MSHSEAVDPSSLSATSVAHISLISAECIGEIAYYLDFSEISTLRLCGHRLLNAKLLRGVEKLHVELSCLQTYPIHAFQYPRLRSLKVTAHSQESYKNDRVPYLVPGCVYVPDGGHPTLEKLSLHGPSCFTVLQPSRSPSALAKLLPYLKELKLESSGTLLPSYFHNLPPTLTALSLKHTGARSKFSSTAMASLPQTLISLVITGVSVAIDSVSSDDEGDNDLISQTADLCFPPSLTRLTVDCNNLDLLMPRIPNTVERLTIGFYKSSTKEDTKVPLIRVSSLPKKNLIAFEFAERSYDKSHILIDEPFPPTLTSLNLPYEDLGDLNSNVDLNTVLPRSLTFFSGFHSLHSTINWSTTLPLLRMALPDKRMFRSGILPESWPPRLALMYLPKDSDLSDQAIAALPNGLRVLRAPVKNSPAWLEKITQLKLLQQLEMTGDATPLPSKGFWDVLHGRLRLVSAEIGHCESIEDVFTDKWTFLFDLKFGANDHSTLHPNVANELALISSRSSETSNAEAPQLRLPSNLRSISWNMTAQFTLLLKPLTELTELEGAYLNLRDGDAKVEQKYEPCYEPLLKLPSSLVSLHLYLPSDLEPKFARSMPRKLRKLVVSHAYKAVSKFTWTPEDFANLPPKLVSLYNPIVPCAIDKLPRTLLSYEGTRAVLRTEATKELETQINTTVSQ